MAIDARKEDVRGYIRQLEAQIEAMKPAVVFAVNHGWPLPSEAHACQDVDD